MTAEKQTFKAVIEGKDGSRRIMEFSSEAEMYAYVEKLNERHLEDLGLIEHLNFPAIHFE